MTNNEIDLLRIATTFYKFTKKNFIMLLIFMVVGLGIGIMKSEYKSSYVTTIKAKPLMRIPFMSLAEITNKQLQLERFGLISTKFGTTKDSVKQIKGIKIVPIFMEKPDGKKKELDEINIIVSIKSDSTISERIFSWLEHLAKTDPYIKERYDLDITNTKLLIKKYETELRKLDSLQFGKTEVKTGQIVIENNTEIQKQKIDLYKQKIGLDSSLQLTRPLVFMTSYTEKSIVKSVAPTIIYPVIFVILGIIFAFTLGLLRQVVKEAKKES